MQSLTCTRTLLFSSPILEAVLVVGMVLLLPDLVHWTRGLYSSGHRGTQGEVLKGSSPRPAPTANHLLHLRLRRVVGLTLPVVLLLLLHLGLHL